VENLSEKLKKIVPEDACILERLILKKCRGGIANVLSDRVICHMDPERFVKMLEEGDIAGALGISKKALEIRNLLHEIRREF
jgi:hypothetical protein